MRVSLFKNKQGATLLEVIVSITIILILGMIGMWYFMKARGGEALNKDRQGVVAILAEARALSLSSKNAASYGVHVEASKAVLFEGSTYSSGASSNKLHTFNSSVQISANSFNGGGNEIIFNRLTGETDDFGTIRLSLVSDAMSSTTITVNNLGVVE
jgi:type II secretory pathway pseudopilin PulG